jgi:hypothetical protein
LAITSTKSLTSRIQNPGPYQILEVSVHSRILSGYSFTYVKFRGTLYGWPSYTTYFLDFFHLFGTYLFYIARDTFFRAGLEPTPELPGRLDRDTLLSQRL